MKKMTAVTAIAIAALMTLNAGAQQDKPKAEGQPPAGRDGQGQNRGARLAETLNLTPEQKPKFEAVMKEANDKRMALRNDTSTEPEKRREKMQAIQEETKTKLKAILTPEQMTKYEEAMKNRGQRGPGGPGGPGGQPGGQPGAGGEPKK